MYALSCRCRPTGLSACIVKNHRLSNTCYFRTLVLTADQSTKLIVPKYKLGKALFKSELTAKRKLPRQSDKAKYSTIGTDLIATIL